MFSSGMQIRPVHGLLFLRLNDLYAVTVQAVCWISCLAVHGSYGKLISSAFICSHHALSIQILANFPNTACLNSSDADLL